MVEVSEWEALSSYVTSRKIAVCIGNNRCSTAQHIVSLDIQPKEWYVYGALRRFESFEEAKSYMDRAINDCIEMLCDELAEEDSWID